jgi:hypothetical protein
LSTFTLLKASLTPYFQSNKFALFTVLAVLVPIFSFVMQVRRRRVQGSGAATLQAGNGQTATVDLVRQRLLNPGSGNNGILRAAWTEIIRVIGDTIRMGGSGLV